MSPALERARGRTALRYLLIVILMLLGISFLLAYSYRNNQSILVDARTLGARIDFEGGAKWRLQGVTHCHALTPKPSVQALEAFAGAQAAAEDAGDDTKRPVCEPLLFAQAMHSVLELEIPGGTTLSIRATPEGGALLLKPGVPREAQAGDQVAADARIGLGARTWQAGDLLVVSHEGWRQTGALAFNGNIVIGEEVTPGSSAYLLEGSYEVRESFLRDRIWHELLESSLLSSDPGPTPVPIKSGTLLRGDSLTFVRTGWPAASGGCRASAPEGETGASLPVLARGFVAPIRDSGVSGFAVRATSDASASCADLSLLSHGARQRLVQPVWTDRALRDPFLLALVAIGGFLVAVVTLLVETARLGEARNDDLADGGGPARVPLPGGTPPSSTAGRHAVSIPTSVTAPAERSPSADSERSRDLPSGPART